MIKTSRAIDSVLRLKSDGQITPTNVFRFPESDGSIGAALMTFRRGGTMIDNPGSDATHSAGAISRQVSGQDSGRTESPALTADM
ncbi:MAG: hypothetical protein ABSA39_22655, partial [Edaphobacter sp.]